jgi:hypothetical protein
LRRKVITRRYDQFGTLQISGNTRCAQFGDPITLNSLVETSSLFSRNVCQVFHLTRYAVNE